jgi:hypothetical protein
VKEFEVYRDEEASMFSFDYIEKSKWLMQYVDSMSFSGKYVKVSVNPEHVDDFKEEFMGRGFNIRELVK